MQAACLQNAEERPPEQFEQLGLDEAPEGNALTTTTRFLKQFLQHNVHAVIQQDSRLKVMHESAEVFNQDTEACFQKLSVRLPTLHACWATCEGWVARSSPGAGGACFWPLLGQPIALLQNVYQVEL